MSEHVIPWREFGSVQIADFIVKQIPVQKARARVLYRVKNNRFLQLSQNLTDSLINIAGFRGLDHVRILT